ncbi:MAG TPA: hypothetical protein VF201_16620 [Nitrolancea sp.]
MMVKKIDHVGVNVDDLLAAKACFLDVGFEAQGDGEVAGTWVDRVVGLKERGTEPFSEVQTYEDVYKLCYVHGPGASSSN